MRTLIETKKSILVCGVSSWMNSLLEDRPYRLPDSDFSKRAILGPVRRKEADEDRTRGNRGMRVYCGLSERPSIVLMLIHRLQYPGSCRGLELGERPEIRSQYDREPGPLGFGTRVLAQLQSHEDSYSMPEGTGSSRYPQLESCSCAYPAQSKPTDVQ